MTREDPPLRLRVFVSSPGDVAAERADAAAIIDALQYDPVLRGRLTFETIAHDHPAVTTFAERTPQASIGEDLPAPADCDVVLVILWKRMGTPLPHPEFRAADGGPVASGTRWEFENAVAAAREHGRPLVLLYHCRAEALVDLDAADFDEQVRQKRAVDTFLAGMRSPDGSIRHAITEYHTHDEFRRLLERDLRAAARRLLDTPPASSPSASSPAASSPVTGAAPLWKGSPFPGLRPFTPEDAPIFFGRWRETGELAALLDDRRFVAVLGASGAGKSSLVGAGLLARLARTGGWVLPSYDPVSRQWEGLRFTPGEAGPDPFLALATRVAPLAGEAPGALAAEPARMAGHLSRLPDKVLIFVDQFEELFTLVAEPKIRPFLALLATLPGRVVITVRSDFYHRCLEFPELARMLERAQFPLAMPDDTLVDMIMRPAERAGLQFEEGLVGRITHDAGRGPGTLPLLAYALDELYRMRGPDGRLTHAAYERLGGVHGAIGMRAEAVFARLPASVQECISRVFRDLIEVDDQGRVARRRAPVRPAGPDDPEQRLVAALTEARLLVHDRGPANEPIFYVAHEALFRSWERLEQWIATFREDLRLLRQARAAAAEWEQHGRQDAYRWLHERLAPVYPAVARLDPDLDETTRAFLEPEEDRLIRTLVVTSLPDHRRQATVDRLVEIGETAIPRLLDALDRPAEAVRDAVVAALVRLGEPAVPGLLDHLYDPFTDVRLATIAALRRIGDRRAIPRLGRLLGDPDGRVRAMAAGALEGFGGAETAEVLTAAIDAQDVDVRWRAAGMLGAFGSAAVPPLLVALRDPDPGVRTTARRAFTTIGSGAIDALVREARGADPAARVGAVQALIALEAVDALTGLTRSDDHDVRWRALEGLGRLARPESLPAVEKLLADPEPAVREAAVRAVAACYADGSPAVLLRVLAGPDPDLRWAAARALADYRTDGVVEDLADLLRTGPGDVAVAAGRALGGIGASALPALVAALAEPGPWRATIAADALVGCGPENLTPLLAALGTRDEQTGELLVAVVAALGDTAVAPLVEYTRTGEPWVRRRATRALAAMAQPANRHVLTTLLTDPDPTVRQAAAAGLSALGRTGLTVLLRAFGHENTGIREVVHEALIAAGSPVVDDLLTIAAGRGVPDRTYAVDILTRIGTPEALFGLARIGIGDPIG